jgi:hypothetical protein
MRVVIVPRSVEIKPYVLRSELSKSLFVLFVLFCLLFVFFFCFLFFFFFFCFLLSVLGPDLREGMESPKAFCLRCARCTSTPTRESSRTWFPLTVEGMGPFLDREKEETVLENKMLGQHDLFRHIVLVGPFVELLQLIFYF